MDFHQNNQKIFTVTIGDTVYSNDHHIMSDQSINSNMAEEADHKNDPIHHKQRHMIKHIKTGVDYVTVRTVDTDVLIFAVANRHYRGNSNSKVRIMFIGRTTRYYDINGLTLSIGERILVSLCPVFTLSQVVIRFPVSLTKVNVSFGTAGKNLKISIC